MSKGTSLIELLVAATLFIIVMAAFLGLFTSAFRYQKKGLAVAEMLSSASYITEYMSRALRMAQKDQDGSCVGSIKTNYDADGGDQITFLNDDGEGECRQFLLGGARLQVRRSLDKSAANFGPAEPLTPSTIDVSDLQFTISGEEQDDVLQPKVTFFIELTTQETEPQTLKLQTTVSQRQTDVRY